VTAVLPGNLATPWQRAVRGPVGQCPLPRLLLKTPARLAPNAVSPVVPRQPGRLPTHALHSLVRWTVSLYFGPAATASA